MVFDHFWWVFYWIHLILWHNNAANSIKQGLPSSGKISTSRKTSRTCTHTHAHTYCTHTHTRTNHALQKGDIANHALQKGVANEKKNMVHMHF